MTIEHECENCYLKDLCKTYLFSQAHLRTFKTEYHDWNFLSLKLQCTHKHPNKKAPTCFDCDKCANQQICILGTNNQCSWDVQVDYLQRTASRYISEHFKEAFLGTLCCKGFSPKEPNVPESLEGAR